MRHLSFATRITLAVVALVATPVFAKDNSFQTESYRIRVERIDRIANVVTVQLRITAIGNGDVDVAFGPLSPGAGAQAFSLIDDKGGLWVQAARDPMDVVCSSSSGVAPNPPGNSNGNANSRRPSAPGTTCNSTRLGKQGAMTVLAFRPGGQLRNASSFTLVGNELAPKFGRPIRIEDLTPTAHGPRK